MDSFPHDPNPEMLDPLLEPYKVNSETPPSPDEMWGRRVRFMDAPRTLCQEL